LGGWAGDEAFDLPDGRLFVDFYHSSSNELNAFSPAGGPSFEAGLNFRVAAPSRVSKGRRG
jgi:hypothetical protein